jgi:hypothetical protein
LHTILRQPKDLLCKNRVSYASYLVKVDHAGAITLPMPLLSLLAIGSAFLAAFVTYEGLQNVVAISALGGAGTTLCQLARLSLN